MVFYIKTWGDLLHHHHHGEETDLFPKLEVLANEAGIKGTPMSANVDEHRDFDQGLLQLSDYLAEIQAGSKAYDGKGVKAYIDDFGPVLTAHLHAEIATLLSLEKCDGATLKKTFNDFVARVVKTADAVGLFQHI